VSQHKSLNKHDVQKKRDQAKQAGTSDPNSTQPWNNISGETSITIIRGQGNNISGETATSHNQSEKIDAAHETVSQHKAYGAMHISENADEQKPDNEPTRNIGSV